MDRVKLLSTNADASLNLSLLFFLELNYFFFKIYISLFIFLSVCSRILLMS